MSCRGGASAAAAALAALLLAAAAMYAVGGACTLAPLAAGRQVPAAARGRHTAAQLDTAAAAAFAAHAASTSAAAYHHISLCSRPHPKFELLQATAAWHGDRVVALGMGDARFQRWGVGFGVKLEQVQAWLRAPGVGDDDVVLFTDAFDVLLMDGSAGIRRAYLAAVRLAMARERDAAAEAAGRPARVPTILFSTERYCWPDAGRAPEYPASDRAHEFAYLNSGTYIGRAGDLRASMARLNYTIQEDDQRYWTSLYLRSRADYSAPRIALDHESDVFLCMSGYSIASDLGFDPTTRRYRFLRAPGEPVVMHFNNAKGEVGEFFNALRGAFCPYAAGKMLGCRVAAAGASAAAAFVLGLLAARLLLAVVAFLLLRHAPVVVAAAAGSAGEPSGGSVVAVAALPAALVSWAPAVPAALLEHAGLHGSGVGDSGKAAVVEAKGAA